MVSILLKDRNLLFVHVPKTAGGSISRLLRSQPDAVAYPVREMNVAEPCVSQLSKQLEKPLRKYRTVAFVRNPWDWTVSSYLHVAENKPAYRNPPTFREFVLGDWQRATILQYPTKFVTPLAYVAYHTQITPWEHLHPNGYNFKVDTIATFENLEEDFRDAFDLETPLPQVNRSQRDHYARYYDTETKMLVANRNAILIKKFSYVFDND